MTDTDLEPLDLVVEAKEAMARDVVRLTLARPDGAALPAWQPGAHIDLLLTPALIRPYSLCSDPADPFRWQIAVLREGDGRGGSVHVHDRLASGDRVRARAPRNHFPLVPSRRYLFLAGGIGVTPLIPMLAEAEHLGADWELVYGGRSLESMAFRDVLCATYGGRVRPVPEDRYALLDLGALLGEPRPDTLVYCCGPDRMLAAVEKHCALWPEGVLHTERFVPREQTAGRTTGNVDSGPADGFEVELARTGRTLTVPPGTSVLEAVEQAGVQVLYSCREGTCGTCETTVLSGAVDHRDSLLTEEEQAANDTMMICVSRAAGPGLVLDL